MGTDVGDRNLPGPRVLFLCLDQTFVLGCVVCVRTRMHMCICLHTMCLLFLEASYQAGLHTVAHKVSAHPLVLLSSQLPLWLSSLLQPSLIIPACTSLNRGGAPLRLTHQASSTLRHLSRSRSEKPYPWQANCLQLLLHSHLFSPFLVYKTRWGRLLAWKHLSKSPFGGIYRCTHRGMKWLMIIVLLTNMGNNSSVDHEKIDDTHM